MCSVNEFTHSTCGMVDYVSEFFAATRTLHVVYLDDVIDERVCYIDRVTSNVSRGF